MPVEGTAKLVAAAVAVAIIMAGIYGFRRAQLGTTARVALGLVMLASGVGLAYWLIQLADDPLSHPIRLGFVGGLVGLGINQVAAPLRLAMGRPA